MTLSRFWHNSLVLLLSLSITSSCKHVSQSSSTAAFLSATGKVVSRGVALGSLRRAVGVPPLTVSSAPNLRLSVAPIAPRLALTTGLSSRVRANDLVIGQSHGTSITTRSGLSLVEFDSDTFPAETVHQVYPNHLPKGAAAVLTGAPVTPQDAAQPASRDVANVTVTEESAPTTAGATPGEKSFTLDGFSTTPAEGKSRQAEAALGKDQASLSAGASTGSPVLVDVDGTVYIAGVVAVNTEAAAATGHGTAAQPSTAYAVDLSSAEAQALLNDKAPGTIADSSAVAGKDLSPWVSNEIFNADDIKFGPEFEFTTVDGNIHQSEGGDIDDWGTWDAKNKGEWLAKYLARINELVQADGGAVTYQDQSQGKKIKGTIIDTRTGAKIQIFPYEDVRVLEIPLGPMTFAEVKLGEALIQRYVYGAAKDIGLVPGTGEINRWSCHLNVSWPGISSKEQTELMMRYYVDVQNRPELGMGIRGGDIRNASPISTWRMSGVIPPGPWEDYLRTFIADFQANPDQYAAPRDLISNLYSKVISGSFQWYNSRTLNRYQAVNLLPMFGEKVDPAPSVPADEVDGVWQNARGYEVESTNRVEERFHYMPQSAAGFTDACLVTGSRINYVAKQTGPIAYTARSYKYRGNFLPTGMQLGLSADEGIKIYDAYLSEMGLRLEDRAEFLVNDDARQAALNLIKSRAPDKRAGGAAGVEAPDVRTDPKRADPAKPAEVNGAKPAR